MANLAILGHATRGKEVIELLEMLGGRNPIMRDGTNTDFYYSIDKRGVIQWERNDHIHYFGVTLEEFLEKFPYKVGDKVATREGEHSKITSMQWNDERGEVMYGLSGHDILVFSATFLQPYPKEETMEENKYRLDKSDDDKLATEVTCDDFKIFAPDNYLIGKVTKVDGGMIVEYVKKQLQYPKTYEECKNIIVESEGYDAGPADMAAEVFANIPITVFCKLIVARNVYWKIAGDWKPDWTNGDCPKYTIRTVRNIVHIDEEYLSNRFLAFQTAEMRDTFYENFKELIEQCKELL